MTANKKTVQKCMDGFMESDHQKILSCLADDVIWEMPGYFNITGKEAFDKEIENDYFAGSPTVKITRLMEEGNVVVAEGSVQCRKKSCGFLDAQFCDVFQLENGKIKQLTTYQMNKTKRLEVAEHV